MRNLRRHNVRWVILSRQGSSFPQEEQWVRTSLLFALRFADQHNLLYELYELRPDPDHGMVTAVCRSQAGTGHGPEWDTPYSR